MSARYMKTSEIGALLGHSNPASTRSWIHHRKLEARERDVETGEKLYDREDVERAIREQPGRGARTDLRSRRDEPPHDDRLLPGHE